MSIALGDRVTLPALIGRTFPGTVTWMSSRGTHCTVMWDDGASSEYDTARLTRLES